MRRKKRLRNIRSVYVDPEKNNWRHKHDGNKKALPGKSDRRWKENKVSLQFSILKPYIYNSLGF
jgi:hypothetical protein